jgi:POTRA domain, FtsQ-type
MRKPPELTRAEAVRSRHRDQTQKRVSDSAVLATRPVAPITARRTMTSGTLARPAQSRVRRSARPLRMPGIEIRMPGISFSSRQLQWRMLSFAVSLLLGAAIYLAWTLPEFQAAPPVVSGNQRISPDEIAAVLNSSGQVVFGLVPADLQARLRRNFPELISASVSTGLPNQVYVTIAERTPAISWQQGDAYTWIDDGGVAFRPHGNALQLITVQALGAPQPLTSSHTDPMAPAPYLSADLVSSIKELAAQAPSGTPLLYDPRYGLGWSDPRGWQVFFGNGAREMPLRLQIYQSVVAMLEAKGVKPAFVSVQYPNAPFYRMNQ